MIWKHEGEESMRHFDYACPSSLDEAIALLSGNRKTAKVLGGGTDLLVDLKTGKHSPSILVSLRKVPGLRGIEKDQNGIRIGACCSLFEVEHSPLVQEKYGVLSQACSEVGSLQIRCRGTIGGNLCHASPAADTAAPLLVLHAQLVLRGSKGERKVEIKDFFAGPGQTVLKEDEILTEIRIPEIEQANKGVYLKLGRRKAMEIAIAGVAVLATRDRLSEKIENVWIGLSSVAPTPIRAYEAESILKGSSVDEKSIEKTATLASECSNPITDVRGSKDYRKEMIKVLTRRALREIL